MQELAKRNIKIHSRINLVSWITFLVPVVTLFYTYTGLSIAEIILISNVTTFCIRIFELPTSVWADISGRKKSLLISVICNVCAAAAFLFFPTFWGFAVAAFFAALYMSFWSGTGQAFLEENLRILDREEQFGRYIGRFMFYNELTFLITPLVASLVLKLLGGTWYMLLAWLDVISAICLVFLVVKLKEVFPLQLHATTFKNVLRTSRRTAREAIKNVFCNKDMKLVTIYRTLAYHAGFMGLIFLPLLSRNGLPDRSWGIIASVISVGSMFAMKYAYKFGEKYSYRHLWVISTTLQGIVIFAVAFFLNARIIMAALFFLGSVLEGFFQPSRNHVLVQLSKWKAIATTRSIVFAVFALYMTIGKQILSFFDIKYALIGLGIFIVLVNVVLGKKILSLKA